MTELSGQARGRRRAVPCQDEQQRRAGRAAHNRVRSAATQLVIIENPASLHIGTAFAPAQAVN